MLPFPSRDGGQNGRHTGPPFPLFAEGARGVAVPRGSLRPVSSPGPDSTSPSTGGSRLSHGVRRDPTALCSHLVAGQGTITKAPPTPSDRVV
jgi:hypothetical protein